MCLAPPAGQRPSWQFFSTAGSSALTIVHGCEVHSLCSGWLCGVAVTDCARSQRCTVRIVRGCGGQGIIDWAGLQHAVTAQLSAAGQATLPGA
jgi:hypothetical protein